MKITWLGWAGIELESVGGDRMVVDPLGDPAAVFRVLGDAAAGIELPEVTAPAGGAVAGLVTHLHRDHADGGALAAALAPGAPVLRPAPGDAGGLAEAALAMAEAELAGLEQVVMAPWQTRSVGGFDVTALPAVDGAGDPQVGWLIEAGGARVIHLGDTMWHGGLWRIGLQVGPVDVALVPINGAVVRFPHRRPASPDPIVMTPEQAALAGEILGARRVIAMHFGGYGGTPLYEPAPEAPARFLAAAEGRPYEAVVPEVGESFGVSPAPVAPAGR